MKIATWQERMLEHHPYGEIEDFKQAEIDALRAEIERLNAGWYDKLLAATLERDEWKDEALSAQGRFKKAEAKLSDLKWQERCKHGVWAADHCYECAKVECDALRKDYALLGEVCEQLIIGAANTVDIVQDADRLAVENAALHKNRHAREDVISELRCELERERDAQRKVLVQALDAFGNSSSYDAKKAAITAIQEQLK